MADCMIEWRLSYTVTLLFVVCRIYQSVQGFLCWSISFRYIGANVCVPQKRRTLPENACNIPLNISISIAVPLLRHESLSYWPFKANLKISSLTPVILVITRYTLRPLTWELMTRFGLFGESGMSSIDVIKIHSKRHCVYPLLGYSLHKVIVMLQISILPIFSPKLKNFKSF